jgi:hypothetical protein
MERVEHVRDLDQMQGERLVRPEHLSRGDAKNKRVTNLPGCAGNSDFKWRLHDSISHGKRPAFV